MNGSFLEKCSLVRVDLWAFRKATEAGDLEYTSINSPEVDVSSPSLCESNPSLAE